MARKLLGSAAGAFALTLGAARHVAWYLGHQISGRPRDAPDDRNA